MPSKLLCAIELGKVGNAALFKAERADIVVRVGFADVVLTEVLADVAGP